jgi:hypothetical protein
MRNQQQNRAHNAVQYAMRAGKLRRPKHCRICKHAGRPWDPIEAHHRDYAEPLKVTWAHRRCWAQQSASRERLNVALSWERRRVSQIEPPPTEGKQSTAVG